MPFCLAIALLLLLAGPARSEEFRLPPLDTFSVTLERPLFTPGRKPPNRPAPTPVADVPAASSRLVGFIADGSGRAVALVRIDGERAERRVRPGETVGNWTVESIAAGVMELSRGGERTEVTLDGEIPD